MNQSLVIQFSLPPKAVRHLELARTQPQRKTSKMNTQKTNYRLVSKPLSFVPLPDPCLLGVPNGQGDAFSRRVRWIGGVL